MSERALFGWQGFSFEHPAEWAPVLISGNRSEGYVRLASAGHIGCQIRWQHARSAPDLRSKLRPYLAKLERDSRKRKEQFRSESKLEDERLLYRWTGIAQGRGVLFLSSACSRVFFLEAIGRRNDSLMPVFRPIEESFASAAEGEPEDWALLGLSLRLPHGLKVERRTLLAGRTQLLLSARGVRIEADRWGFAEQLIARHGFEGWARAALGMPRAEAVSEGNGLRVTGKTRWGTPISALVMHEAEKNQLTLIKAVSKHEQWKPQWDWICTD